MKWRTLALLTLMPALASAASPPGIPDGWSDGYAYANGIRVHYYRAAPAPGKPAIVMVHGVSDIGLSWTTLTWKLQGSYDIYMLDARGHGLSDPFTASDTGDTLVKDVVEFVRTMKLEKPILMGHSMGAATVRRIGAEYPDLAKAIVMLDPGLGGGPPASPSSGAPAAASPAVPASATALAPDRQATSMRPTPEVLVAQNNQPFDDLVAKCRKQTPNWDVVDCQVPGRSRRSSTTVSTRTRRGRRCSAGCARATRSRRFRCPCSSSRRMRRPTSGRRTRRQRASYPRGGSVHIDGAGHNLHHDQLARTVEVLTGFLSTFQ